MKDDVGYEKFLAAVYEAENEGTESKVLNVKAKAMTVEKVMDVKEKIDLKDLKQQIESLSMVMKSATIGSVKNESKRGNFLPKEERIVWEYTTKRDTRITQEGKDFLRTRSKTYTVLLM